MLGTFASVQETLRCSFTTCSPRPRTSILALRIQLQRLTMDTNAVNVSSPESSTGFSRKQRHWLVLSGHSQPWRGDRRAEKVNTTAMRCRSISFSSCSLHLPVRSKFLIREIDQVVYAMQPLSRSIKAKSPKPSSWEDSSPSKSTANNQTAVKASRAPFILTSRENARAFSLKF